MAQAVTAKNDASQNQPGGEDAQAQADIAAQENLLLGTGHFSVEAVEASRVYQENEALLKHEVLDKNEYYSKLRARINAFFVLCEKYRIKGPTDAQLEHFRKSGFSFEYRKRLYQCLKDLMVKCIKTKPYKNQVAYTRNVYIWFFYKLVAMQDISKQEQENELRFINPTINQLQNQMKTVVAQKYSSHLCNDEEQVEVNKAMFEIQAYGGAERSLLGDLQPANQRLKDYKRKSFGPLLDEKVKEVKDRDAKYLHKKRIKEHQEEHGPAGLCCAHLGSIYDDYELKQKDDESTQASSQFSASKARPFSQSERASKQHPFQSFYTNEEVKVMFETKNRFEGKSNYFSYMPAGDLVDKTDEAAQQYKHVEQKLEQFWFENKNRELAEKRRDEENMQIMNEWANARGRMEAEIQRRKEHLNFATKFEKARGFVRTNWKTKNFDPNDDPTQYDSSTDESEYDEEVEREGHDQVPGEEALVQKNPFPAVSEQIATLKAVQEYNEGLKPARRGKDEIGEVESNNLTAQSRYKEHPKTKAKMEYKVYTPVGIIEGEGDDEGRFSVEAKARSIQRASSQHKIDKIRQLQGKLIGADKVPTQQALYFPYTSYKDPELLAPKPADNPFDQEDDDREISLSIYSQPKAVAKRRPHTAKNATELLQFIPGFKAPPTIGPDGTTMPSVPYEAPPKSARPDNGDGLHMLEALNMADCDKVRKDEVKELLDLRDRLIRERHEADGKSLAEANNENMKALMRAVIQPDVKRFLPSTKKYPETGAQYNLMPNPFPSKKKKGKKGKKKKR